MHHLPEDTFLCRLDTAEGCFPSVLKSDGLRGSLVLEACALELIQMSKGLLEHWP